MWDCSIQIEYYFQSCFCMSLVLILRVFCIRRFYRGSFFLLSTDSTTRVPGDKGGSFFFRLWIFFGARKIVQFLRKIECIKFVCNKFVLVLVQIDLIQFEIISFSTNWFNTIWINSNCIKSICTKTNTNLLDTNSIHSIWHKNRTISQKIEHVIQIVVHQFVHKTSAEKNS